MSKNYRVRSPLRNSSSPTKKPLQTTPAMVRFIENPRFSLVLLAIFVAVICLLRWRLIGMPLERDEGEYAYFGQLILNGVPPYQEAYNMKLPGIYYMYALIMLLFGQTPVGIHIGLLIINAASMILLFLSLKKFFNLHIGLLVAAQYGLMALSPYVLGFAAHATHFVVFFVTLGLFFMEKVEETRSVRTARSLLFALLTGAMLGTAFLMKQHAVYFILFGGMMVVLFPFCAAGRKRNLRSILQKEIAPLGMYCLGVFLPYSIVVLLMLASGTFEKFWFWTVTYASTYVSGVSWESGKAMLAMSFLPLLNEQRWIWMFALVGLGALLFGPFTTKQKVLATGFIVFALLTTTPGLYFRQHYFIATLPAVALLAAIALDSVGTLIAKMLKKRALAIALPLVAVFFIVVTILTEAKGYYLRDDPNMLCKKIYGINPFVESIDIAEHIKNNSLPSDRIAILGSEPQIAFYANRRSATGYIYTYMLMEAHDYNVAMQEEMISEIERWKPSHLVFVNVHFSWVAKPHSPTKILDWYKQYSKNHYRVVGLVDIPDTGVSRFSWGDDAQRAPENKNFVWILERKE